MPKSTMQTAQAKLSALLERDQLTAGMYVRIHGDHLILGRREAIPGTATEEAVDSVRLTRLNGSQYGLSVRRHTGRWERTPFTGSLYELVDTISTFMQHLVAPR